MPKICYVEKSFNPEHTRIIGQANKIIAGHAAQGFDLTLRQLYYQFVSKDLFPESWADPKTGSTNNDRSYKRLVSIINDARLAGAIDWDAIVDRTRNLRSLASWTDPADRIASASRSHRLDKWKGQDYRVEVWIEKDALIGVIEGICNELEVPFFSCRGYTSQSEIWGAAMRLNNYKERGQNPVVIHLGDHDPSGIDMTRDIADRFKMFCGDDVESEEEGTIIVERIALNMPQIEEHNPPPNPCKITDSRAGKYIEKYGGESWELDALEPSLIATLIRNTVYGYRDPEKWEERLKQEEDESARIMAVSINWEKIVAAGLHKTKGKKK